MQGTQRRYLFLLLCALCNLASLRWELIKVVDLSSYEKSASQLRTLHRPANLEDLFLKLTGRQIREDA